MEGIGCLGVQGQLIVNRFAEFGKLSCQGQCHQIAVIAHGKGKIGALLRRSVAFGYIIFFVQIFQTFRCAQLILLFLQTNGGLPAFFLLFLFLIRSFKGKGIGRGCGDGQGIYLMVSVCPEPVGQVCSKRLAFLPVQL